MSFPQTGNSNEKQLLVPLIIADLLLFSLFSLLLVQTFIYYYAFATRDRLPIKIIVFCVFTLLLAQAIFAGHNHVTNIVGSKNTMGLGWFFVPVLGGIVSLVVQHFYAWRIYVLSRRFSVALVISLLSLVSTTASFVSGGFGARVGELQNFSSDPTQSARTVSRSAAVCYVCSALCDVVIAVCMIILLTRGGKIMDRNVRYVVKRLIVLTIETNAVTSLVAVLSVILLLGFPGTNYFATTTLLLPILYGNTFLMTLLSRICLVPAQEKEGDDSLSRISFVHVSGLAQARSGRDVEGLQVPGRDAHIVAVVSFLDDNNFQKASSPGAVSHPNPQ